MIQRISKVRTILQCGQQYRSHTEQLQMAVGYRRQQVFRMNVVHFPYSFVPNLSFVLLRSRRLRRL